MSEMKINRAISNIFDLVLLSYEDDETDEIVTAFHGDEAEAMINA
jgi:hypothetical protein